MEHLLSPSGAGPISIPYVGGRVFEADTTPSTDILYYLKSYWDRAGWQRHPVTGDLSFRNRSPLEIVQSLQTSLYFGPLLSIFSRVGVHISTRDFLETSPTGQEIFVHTTNLPRFIAEWAKREGFSNGPPVSTGFTPKYMRGENIKEMLSWALYYLQTFFTQESKAMVEPYKSHMQLVELSIMAMGESLCSVLCAIYGYSMGDMATWGPSPILRARLRQNGWCTSDSPFFPESMASVSISADYYFGSFPCPRQRGDHSECTAAICNEYCKKIKADEYEQKHVSSNCSCKAVEIPDEAIHLVARKQIPTVLWDGLEMKVSIGSILNPYVAVSHVWSDGIGNDDKRNSLWTCQLSRIQSLVNQFRSEMYPATSNARRSTVANHDDRMIPFWIDTLCVPVGEKNRYLEGDKTRDLRKEAIGQMAETYRQADRVLVLDSFILKLPYSADVIDKYLGIHLSNWHHRLWTMQEGQLASRLFFQFRNGAQSLDMIKRYELHTIDRLAPQNLCSPVRLLCASELESFYRESELNSNRRSNITARLRSCAHYLRSRETSRSEDEAVCVANILGLDAKRILRHDGADDRMACLFDLIGVLDPRIIFHNHPRLKKDGYRWAPGTFLRQLPDIIVFPDTQAKWANSIPVAVIPGGGGFPVSFGGFEFSHESATLLRRGSTMFVKQVTNGLGPPRRPGDPSAPWFGCVYKMEVQQVPNDVHLLQSRQHQRWAVILPFYLEKDYLPFSGILGIIDDGAPPRPAAAEQIQRSVWTAIGPHGVQLPAYAIPYRIRVRFVCRVNVSMPAQETVPRNAPLTWVWAYNIQQEWCLR